MKLLLDTHIWWWSLAEPERLTRRVANELRNSANELWLSPISTWELLLLAEKQRVRMPTEPILWIRAALSKAPFREALINHEIAIESRRVSLQHADPADRILAATAIVYNLTLVTADQRLLRGKGFPVLANR